MFNSTFQTWNKSLMKDVSALFDPQNKTRVHCKLVCLRISVRRSLPTTILSPLQIPFTARLILGGLRGGLNKLRGQRKIGQCKQWFNGRLDGWIKIVFLFSLLFILYFCCDDKNVSGDWPVRKQQNKNFGAKIFLLRSWTVLQMITHFKIPVS